MNKFYPVRFLDHDYIPLGIFYDRAIDLGNNGGRVGTKLPHQLPEALCGTNLPSLTIERDMHRRIFKIYFKIF